MLKSIDCNKVSQRERENLIIQRYRNFFDCGDMPNAVELWGEYVPAHFREVVTRDGGHNFLIASIISSFMPKSGGTFLHNRMVADAGYGDFWWGVTDSRNASSVYTSDACIHAFRLGGFTCHTHFMPHPQVMSVLDRCYPSPIWVHLRSPIDCVIAGYHHYLGQAQGSGQPKRSRIAGISEEAARLGLDLSDLLSFVETHIPFYIGWASEWVNFDAANPGRVHFTFFDEMDNVSGLLNRVFTSLDTGARVGAVSPIMDNDRIRLDETRHEIGASQRAILRDRVASELEGFHSLDRLL